MRSSRLKGFTILELLVAAAVSSMVALAMVMIYSTAVTSLNLAAGRQEVQNQCRLTLERMTPYISSACSESASSQTSFGVYGSGAGVSGAPSSSANKEIVFYSNEDFLRTPPTLYNPRATNIPAPHKYVLGWASDTDRNIVLRELYHNDDWPNPQPSPRIISRSLFNTTVAIYQSTSGGSGSINSVELEATATSTVRRAQRDNRNVSYSLRTAVTIPTMLKQ